MEEDKNNKNDPFDMVPDEVLMFILSLVSPYGELSNAARVNKRFRACAMIVRSQLNRDFVRHVQDRSLLWTCNAPLTNVFHTEQSEPPRTVSCQWSTRPDPQSPTTSMKFVWFCKIYDKWARTDVQTPRVKVVMAWTVGWPNGSRRQRSCQWSPRPAYSPIEECLI